MAGKLAGAATAAVIQKLTSPQGVNANLAALTAPDSSLVVPLETAQIRSQNAGADLAERSHSTKYPCMNVYCEKLANTLTEKFRTFSGTLRVSVEVRHSQDKLDGLQDVLELYVDSVTQVLDASRGDWGSGMYYSGAYEVLLAAVKHGGRNFMQTAKISFDIGVSRN
ncbi:MAG: hypothetical protein C5B51_17235 [Terriglobia bacterium]|nr:MAG: hypothetical protein C5B51_17235 [Terriglobia bacterium]